MKKLLLAIAVLTLSIASNAQTNNSPIGFDKTKLTFGGGFGLQFGDYTLVNVSPQVGYSFSKIFNAGAGISYSYYGHDYDHGPVRYEDTRSYVGFNVYGKVYPIPNIVLMVQPEANRMWNTSKNKVTGEKFSENKFVPAVVVGGGVRLGPLTAMLQYDVVQDKYTPYSNKIFYSVGYTFGF